MGADRWCSRGRRDRDDTAMSHEYDYPDDTPTREEMEQAEADRNPPECICASGICNPDCYWHGTEGVEPAQ